MGFARGLLESLTRRGRVDLIPDPDDTAAPTPAPSVDGHTRRFWAGNEAAGQPGGRVAALVAAHERGRSHSDQRPRGNPAFSEALFVELMRAQQFARAYRLLTPDCQQSWGNLERFILAHRDDDSLRVLSGVNVLAARDIDGWIDPELGTSHDHAVELDVEYAFAAAERTATVRRTVHLVGVDGKWRSLCYPG